MDGQNKDQTPGMQLPLAAHQEDPQLTRALKRIKNKIFVVSGKGGVGKSSVTVNLAAAIASLGCTVGILDVDLHGPSVPGLLGIAEANHATVRDGKIRPVEAGPNLKVISVDTLLQDRKQAVVWRGPKKSGAIRQFIADVDWGDLDFMFIDSPPGTGDEHLTVLKLIPDARSLVVTTPQEVALADVRKAVNFLKMLNAPILGVVENMSAFACPHCGGRIDLFQPDGGLELAREFALPFLGAIPLDPAAARAADKGVPAVLLPEAGPAKSAFFALAESVKNACGAACPGK